MNPQPGRSRRRRFYSAANFHPEGSPEDLYGSLFRDVQRSGIFPDQKTFVDCVPKETPTLIRQKYREARQRFRDALDLRSFVEEHFLIPEARTLQAFVAESVEHHIETLWQMLRREPDLVREDSSLLPLAHPYVIPGGRFREIYYWDSYFTMLGLREHGREDLIRSMVVNCADLLRAYRLVPNGNRTYYLTRSQPPVLAYMVDFLAEKEGSAVYQEFLPALRTEWDYWHDFGARTRHAVTLADGSRMQRYYDQGTAPRLEAFSHDEAICSRSRQEAKILFRHIRSGAESGWDFSSRWFIDGDSMESIQTTEFIPVDLNCFLAHLERTLAHAYDLAGDVRRSRRMDQAARHRIAAIQRHCWSFEDGFYFDYRKDVEARSRHFTLAGMVPLFARIATEEQAGAVARVLRERFLRPGGLVTSLTVSGEQWDAPNGWAPLHWMAITGLRQYGHHELAAEVAGRWIRLNIDVHNRTGRLMEKYNVADLSLSAGGGEYPTQDGFGWTNGVLMKLLRLYPQNG